MKYKKKCIEKIQFNESSLTGYWVQKVLKVSKRFNYSKTFFGISKMVSHHHLEKKFTPKPKKLIQIQQKMIKNKLRHQWMWKI